MSGRRTALHDALYDAARYLREAGPGRPPSCSSPTGVTWAARCSSTTACSRPEALAAAPVAGKPDLSPTVLALLNITEEHLDKTVMLRERPVLSVTRGPGAGRVF